MLRALVLTGLLAVAPVAVLNGGQAAAQAQYPSAQGQPANPQKCQDTPEKQAKRSMFGSILGSIGGGLLGRAGNVGSVVAAALPATSYLTDQLLKLLDCKEQQQAAKATDQAIRGGVGTEVSWKSESRPNVTGTLEGHQPGAARRRRSVPDGHRRRDRRRGRNHRSQEDVQGQGRERIRQGVRMMSGRIKTAFGACLLLLNVAAAQPVDPANPTCPEYLNWSTYPEMKFTLETVGGLRVLKAEGQIDEDVAARLQDALKANNPVQEIWFRSPGGDARAGNAAGKIIRASMIPTRIPAGWACFSSCNFMFMGGAIRYVDEGRDFRGPHVHAVSDKQAVRSELKRHRSRDRADRRRRAGLGFARQRG